MAKEIEKKTLSNALFEIGENHEKYYNAVAPPIIQSSNFRFNSIQEIREAFTSERDHHLYTRGNNPTVTMLNQKIAAIQGTEDAIVFSTGAAAIAITITSLLSAGDHVICVENCYGWTYRLMTETLQRFKVECTFVDGRKIENFKSAKQDNTTLIILESPTSFVFDVQDIYSVASWAKNEQITTFIDHTFASPLNHVPVDAGIDFIMHTTSKYINGHSDSNGGVICATKEKIDQLFSPSWMTYGAVMPPHDAWLCIRGLRTLDIRLKQSIATTKQVIIFLSNHPMVKKIYHPMNPEHPQNDLAKEQIGQYYPLFSVEFHELNLTQVDSIVNGLNVFKIAVSWGGFESLALSALSKVQGQDIPLLRLYIGLEELNLLKEDLDQAINKLMD